MTDKVFNILSIEDNEPDFTLLEKALRRIPDLQLNIINISDGKDALNYIFKKEEYENASTPDLIVLDINLPKINGYEIVERIKNDKKYKVIPVIMFSTSNSEEDIQKSYLAHANSYIIKSFDIKSLFEKIATMGEYWLKASAITKADSICIINNEFSEGE